MSRGPGEHPPDARAAELASRYGLHNPTPAFLQTANAGAVTGVEAALSAADLTAITTGTIPFRVSDAHRTTLGRACLTQVEDCINVASEDPRGASRTGPSTMVLMLTDGAQVFGGIELEPFGGRLLRATPGTKLLLGTAARIWRGRVLLTPATATFVGTPPHRDILWGATYEAKKREALVAANLKPPGGNNFDALASNADQITSLGGIAHIEPEDDDAVHEAEDDGAFWMQALAQEQAVLAGQHVTPAVDHAAQRSTIPETAPRAPTPNTHANANANATLVAALPAPVVANSAVYTPTVVHILDDDHEPQHTAQPHAPHAEDRAKPRSRLKLSRPPQR